MDKTLQESIDVFSADQRMERYRLIGDIGHEVLYLSNKDMQVVLEYIKKLITSSGVTDE